METIKEYHVIHFTSWDQYTFTEKENAFRKFKLIKDGCYVQSKPPPFLLVVKEVGKEAEIIKVLYPTPPPTKSDDRKVIHDLKERVCFLEQKIDSLTNKGKENG